MNNLGRAGAKEAIDYIRHSAGLQFLGAAQWATDSSCHGCLHRIAASVEERLEAIAGLAEADRIRPFCRIVLDEGGEQAPLVPRSVRIGVYPIAANPMHWGHVLVALMALETLKLDKIVFVIAGDDRRKPSMLPAEARHHLGRSVVEAFRPLFSYSPLALGTDLDGEANFARLLALNPYQPMDAFYIAGADHYRRTTDQGEPDTIQKLEQVVARHASTRHSISAVFVRRRGVPRRREQVVTSVNVHVLPPIPFTFSSTSVRQALVNDESCEALVSLPYSCLLEIRTRGLYAQAMADAG